MIFVTVGVQLPFDRLVRTVDTWALGRNEAVFAQVGDGQYRPENIEWSRFLSPPEFRERLAAAEVIIAHAGMGSILTALEHGKPIVVMPRNALLREHRNDHQRATAEHFRKHDNIRVAMDERELVHELGRIGDLSTAPRTEARASEELLHAIREFLTR